MTKHDSCTLERLDCSLGYTKGNVVPCCHACNWAKGTMTWEFMIEQPLLNTFGKRIRDVREAERVRYEQQVERVER